MSRNTQFSSGRTERHTEVFALDLWLSPWLFGFGFCSRASSPLHLAFHRQRCTQLHALAIIIWVSSQCLILPHCWVLSSFFNESTTVCISSCATNDSCAGFSVYFRLHLQFHQRSKEDIWRLLTVSQGCIDCYALPLVSICCQISGVWVYPLLRHVLWVAYSGS